MGLGFAGQGARRLRLPVRGHAGSYDGAPNAGSGWRDPGQVSNSITVRNPISHQASLKQLPVSFRCLDRSLSLKQRFT